MAEETTEAVEQKPKRGRLGLVAAMVLGGALGVAGGVVFLGPIAADLLASNPGPEEREAAPLESYSIENLVLNPAGTGGTRFLMATIVAQVEGEAGLEAMQEREPEIRDRLMALLGGKTVEELTDVRGREGLKAEILQALHSLGLERIHAVFLPTFVIQ